MLRFVNAAVGLILRKVCLLRAHSGCLQVDTGVEPLGLFCVVQVRVKIRVAPARFRDVPALTQFRIIDPTANHTLVQQCLGISPLYDSRKEYQQERNTQRLVLVQPEVYRTVMKNK